MEMWKELPRDMQLHVVKHFDMDTRIRLGLVFKLRVPGRVKDLLESKVKPPYGCKYFSGVFLGRREYAGGDYHGVYKLFYYNDTLEWSPRWEVGHTQGYQGLCSYYLKNDTWVREDLVFDI